tara:strand:- start:16 stop:723 length:708 start_codon:yes stop_codon:yes gene_type:complete
MALPKLNTPTYELELPSTAEKIKYRPFLVKEQKVLMMAQDSGEDQQIAEAMGNLVSSCTFGKVDAETSPMFDLEYVFLKVRGKSVGETVQLSLICPDDEKTTVPVNLKLDDIEVQMLDNHTNEINISESVKVVFRYPLLNDMKSMDKDSTDIQKVFHFLVNCMHEIHYDDDVYRRIDLKDKEIEDFIDQFTGEQFELITNFFNSMPKLRHTVEVTNPKTKVKSEVVLEGLESFLG